MEKILVIFSDLDKTFNPIGLLGKAKFIELVKKIQENEKIKVKFCPISGRPGDYVMGIMDSLEGDFSEAGVENIIDYGAGEQGGVIIQNRLHKHTYIGQDKDLKHMIQKVVENSKFKDLIVEEVGCRYSCTYALLGDSIKNLSTQERIDLCSELRNTIHRELEDRVETQQTKFYLEVTPKGVGKDKAISWIMNEYHKKYEIVGISFSGDGANDIKAVDYVSRLSEIPGIKANVFLPSNAQRFLESEEIEAWKEKIKNVSKGSRIKKGDKPYFEGVMQLINEAYQEKSLIETRKKATRTMDDLALLKKSTYTSKFEKSKKQISKEDSYLNLELKAKTGIEKLKTWATKQESKKISNNKVKNKIFKTDGICM